MSLSLAKIEAMAPDQGSLDAARKLLKPANWPTIAEDGSGLLWGECQGSGATPYRISVTEMDAGYKCTCPSRKFPCKHSLALMWMRAEAKTPFVVAAPPDWVKDWLSRRRGPSAAPQSADDAGKPKASIGQTVEAEEIIDPKAEARAAAARERNRKDREASIANGLDEFDLWISDQLDTGIAAFAGNAGQLCRVMAPRLFDAKASGLALLVDTLPARLFALPEAARPLAAAEELGQMHLLADAYRRQDLLPSALRQDVRQTIGWSMTREALLDDPDALRMTGSWRVWATRVEVQPDKLRRIETWLLGQFCHAVLIEFVPVSTGASSSGFSVGDSFEAEFVFYPSPVPQRAIIARQTTGAAESEAPLDLPNQDLPTAYEAYERALAEKPWLWNYPLAFGQARVRRAGEQYYLAGQGLSLPLDRSQAASCWPLLQFERVDGIGLWNGKTLTLGWLETPIGRWTA